MARSNRNKIPEYALDKRDGIMKKVVNRWVDKPKDGWDNDWDQQCMRMNSYDKYIRNKQKIDKKSKEYRQKNKEKLKISKKIYYENNKETVIKQYKQLNSQRLKQFAKIYAKENQKRIKQVKKKYYEQHKQQILQKKRQKRATEEQKQKRRQYAKKTRQRQNERYQQRIQNDPVFALRVLAKALITGSLQSKGFYKNNTKTTDILGCEIETFKNYIQNQFTDGMSWYNRGKNGNGFNGNEFGWWCDHIYPSSQAQNQQQLLKLNHYTNFKPMWGLQNIKKGDKKTPEGEEMCKKLLGRPWID